MSPDIRTYPSAEGVTQRARSLREEVAFLHENWQAQGLPANWRYLPGTGFDVRLQTDMLFRELAETDAPTDRRAKTDQWLRRTDLDIVTFDTEYLARGVTFPISYRILPSEGRVIDPAYEKDVEDLISAEERNGIVKKTNVEVLKPIFLKAPHGSVAVMDSPSGWSGLREKWGSGRVINFPDSQTYVYQKVGNEIRGLTIRTDFSNVEHRALIKALTGKELAENARLEEYVAAAALIKPQEDFHPDIRLIAEVMRRVRQETTGQNHAWIDDETGKVHGWDEVFDDIRNRDTRCDYRGTIKKRCQELSEFVRYAWNGSQDELDEALAVTVLRISRELRSDEILQKMNEPQIQSLVISEFVSQYDAFAYVTEVTYGAALSDAQDLGGCNGGGQGNGRTSQIDMILQSNGVPRRAQAETEVLQSSFCMHCQAENTDDHYHCEGAGGEGGCGVMLSSDRGKPKSEMRKACPDCGTEFNC